MVRVIEWIVEGLEKGILPGSATCYFPIWEVSLFSVFLVSGVSGCLCYCLDLEYFWIWYGMLRIQVLLYRMRLRHYTCD